MLSSVQYALLGNLRVYSRVTLSTHTHIHTPMSFYLVKKSQHDKDFCRIKLYDLQDLRPAVLSQRLFSTKFTLLKSVFLKIIALFLLSFWCTTFLFLSLRCNISSGGVKIIRFLLFEFVLRVFFAEDFGIRIDEILLKRNFFNMLLLFLRRFRNPSE